MSPFFLLIIICSRRQFVTKFLNIWERFILSPFIIAHIYYFLEKRTFIGPKGLYLISVVKLIPAPRKRCKKSKSSEQIRAAFTGHALRAKFNGSTSSFTQSTTLGAQAFRRQNNKNYKKGPTSSERFTRFPSRNTQLAMLSAGETPALPGRCFASPASPCGLGKNFATEINQPSCMLVMLIIVLNFCY
jgi:hypothetical protein